MSGGESERDKEYTEKKNDGSFVHLRISHMLRGLTVRTGI